MKLEIINKYLPVPRRSRNSEFWCSEVIEEIRRMAILGRPLRIFREGLREYRILDRLSFQDKKEKIINDFDPKEVEDVDLDLEVAYGAIIVNTPVYFSDMSFGALNGNPNIALAAIADEFGAITGIGEGGLHPEVAKFRRIFVQWASARFGIDINVLMKGIGITIKIGQGAKPGIGGHLPGSKVTEIISMTRRIPPGTDALSPAPHHDIYSIEDLGQRIEALKVATGKPVFVKVAATNYIPYIVSGIARMGADGVIIDGHGAGTGATPIVVRDSLGIPLELAVASADKILRREGLREGFTIVASGRITSADDAAKLFALGADMVSFGTAALIAMGCIMCHTCNLGKCPAGLASRLSDGSRIVDLDFAIQRVRNFMRAFSYELKLILKELGLKRLKDLIGRRDLLTGRNIDDEVAELLGVKVLDPTNLPTKLNGDLWQKRMQYIRKLSEEGDVIVVGMGSDAPPEVESPKRIIDWLRIDGAQVTRPSVDPYREFLDLSTTLANMRLSISAPLIIKPTSTLLRYVNELAVVAHMLNILLDLSDVDVIPKRHLNHVMTSSEVGRIRIIKHSDEVITSEKPTYVKIPSSLDMTRYVSEYVKRGINGIIIDETLSESSDDIEITLVEIDRLLRRIKARYYTDLIIHTEKIRGADDIVKLIGIGADVVEISKIIELSLGDLSKIKSREEVIEKVAYTVSALKREIALIAGAAGVYSFYSTFPGCKELLRSLDMDIKLRRFLEIKLAGSW
ncbi:MAG: glutamate synthase [Thermoprotei archaeon ex4572_64]|nr:MAG: glutamate synthase [Thermoprotei archaeon ex4572_64]